MTTPTVTQYAYSLIYCISLNGMPFITSITLTAGCPKLTRIMQDLMCREAVPFAALLISQIVQGLLCQFDFVRHAGISIFLVFVSI